MGSSEHEAPPKGGGDALSNDIQTGRVPRGQPRDRRPAMVKDLTVPQDVLAALSAHPQVHRVWEAASPDHKEVWLTYIEQATSPAHRERRIEILIAGLRP